MTLLIPDAAFPDDHPIERAAAGSRLVVIRRETDPANIPAAEWGSARAVIGYHQMRFDAGVVARLTDAKVLVRAGTGYDNVDLAAFGARGIAVCNVPDYGTHEVADHAAGLLLALARGIVGFHESIRADPVAGWDWRRWPASVRRLHGRHLLLIGLGAIGTAVARRMAGFGMTVGFVDPSVRPGFDLALSLQRFDSLTEGLAWADAVSLHAPLTDRTRHLIGAQALGNTKAGLILVNTARGALIDLDALHAALKSGHLAGAALDVLEREPPDPTHPLIQAFQAREPWLDGRLILTPHAAFLSHAAITDMRRKSVETALAVLERGDLSRCVNREYLVGG